MADFQHYESFDRGFGELVRDGRRCLQKEREKACQACAIQDPSQVCIFNCTQ